MKDNERFRPNEHIRRRVDFEQAYDAGARASGRFMTIFVRTTQQPAARLGIAATRKIGGSVLRNRAKRLIRELFRRRTPSASIDIVVVPRREFLHAPYQTLEREFSTLVDRASASGDATDRSARPRRARRSGADTRV